MRSQIAPNWRCPCCRGAGEGVGPTRVGGERTLACTGKERGCQALELFRLVALGLETLGSLARVGLRSLDRGSIIESARNPRKLLPGKPLGDALK